MAEAGIRRPTGDAVMAPLTLEVLTDRAAFEALKPEWDDLFARAGMPQQRLPARGQLDAHGRRGEPSPGPDESDDRVPHAGVRPVPHPGERRHVGGEPPHEVVALGQVGVRTHEGVPMRVVQHGRVGEGDDVHDAVALAGEVVHLAAKGIRTDGELVPLVRDPVVEEDPERSALVRLVPPCTPRDRARARRARLERVERSRPGHLRYPAARCAVRPPTARPTRRLAGASPSK